MQLFVIKFNYKIIIIIKKIIYKKNHKMLIELIKVYEKKNLDKFEENLKQELQEK